MILPNSASSQLQALQARLDRLDEDMMCHYAGMSQLVASLAAYTPTAPAAASSLPIYNFSSQGQELLKSLLHMIPGYDTFRSLQHTQAASLLGSMEGTLQRLAGGIVDTAAAQVESLVQQQTTALASLATAQANLLAGQAAGAVGSELATLQGAVTTAQQTADTVASLLTSAQSNHSSVSGFLQQLIDIAQLRTRSQVLDGSQGS